MNIKEINNITSSLYQFNTYDWARNRDGFLIIKVQLCTKEQKNVIYNIIKNYKDTSMYIWDGNLNSENVATTFNNIFSMYKEKEFNGIKYVATSINVKGTSEVAFLFIMGEKID
jgi:hypothetical protein